MSKDKKSMYYDAGGIETLDIIKAKLTPEQYRGYLHGNALKYLCRTNFKEGVIRDVEKAINYLTWLNEECEEAMMECFKDSVDENDSSGVSPSPVCDSILKSYNHSRHCHKHMKNKKELFPVHVDKTNELKTYCKNKIHHLRSESHALSREHNNGQIFALDNVINWIDTYKPNGG